MTNLSMGRDAGPTKFGFHSTVIVGLVFLVGMGVFAYRGYEDKEAARYVRQFRERPDGIKEIGEIGKASLLTVVASLHPTDKPAVSRLLMTYVFPNRDGTDTDMDVVAAEVPTDAVSTDDIVPSRLDSVSDIPLTAIDVTDAETGKVLTAASVAGRSEVKASKVVVHGRSVKAGRMLEGSSR